MIKLLKKEFDLFLVRPALLFLSMSALMLIPAYPSIVVLFFSFFILQLCFQIGKENRDIEFTAMLPVSRNQIVLAKILFVLAIQLFHLLLCGIFGAISSLILNPEGNFVGMDKNLVLFGYALIATAIYNLIFFTKYFKNCKKIGAAMVLGIVGFGIFSLAFEFFVAFIPSLNAIFDTLNKDMLPVHAIFFVCSALIFLALSFLTYKISIKSFDKTVI